MKRVLIILCLLFVAFVSYSQQPYDYYRPITSDSIAVDSNLYINNIGMNKSAFIQYSVDSLIWSEERMNGWKYYRFSNDLKQTWSKAISLTYQLDSVEFVEIDPKGVARVSVLGTNTKTINIILRDSTNISTSFVDLVSEEGLGDNWGSDVVNSDITLLGNGTLGDVLRVDTTLIATKASVQQLSEITESEITAGSSSTLRSISGRRAAFIAERNKGTANPQPLGSSSVGVSVLYSRQDHVHPMPTIEVLGLVSITGKATNDLLQWNGTNWVNRTLAQAGVQPTLTTGNLTENITGLEFSQTRMVIGGATELRLTTGYTIPTTTQSSQWSSAYNDKINSAAFSGTTTKTLTLTQQDEGVVTASFTDNDNQTLSFISPSLSISGGNSVNLSSINTDNQTLALDSLERVFTLSISNGNSVKWKDNDTQYTEISESEITSGVSSTLRTISGRRAAFIAERNKGTATPLSLGSASVGTSILYSRQDHVHPMPSIESLNLVSISGKANNHILQWDGLNWINRSLFDAGIQPTLTTGNLTESIEGLEFSATRQVIGGSANLQLSSGYIIPTITQESNWTSGYNDKINSAAFLGTTTKTLTLTQQDGGTVTANFSDINTTYQNDVTDSGVGASLELKGSDSSSDFTYFNSGYGVDVLYTDASTMTFKADTSKLATQYDLTQIGGGGSSPGGTGTELQYRLNSTTFGGLTGSSVSGSNITLGGSLGMDYSLNNWMMQLWNRHSTSALGLAVLAGQNDQERTIVQFNSAQGLPVFSAHSNGKVRMENLPSATQTNVLYIDANGYITKGAAGGGSGSPLTTKGDIYTYSTGDTRLPVGTNGQILSANSATTTGLQWINPPSGSSIWTDAGTYAHLNGYEDIYMPRGKSLSWRSTTADVTGTNTFRITPADASQLRIYAGAGDHEAVNIYNANAAKLTAFSVKGNLGADLGASATYETDSYSLLNLAANGFNKFVVTGAGTFASAEQASSPATPASGYGYWYNKTDGKPYFKNSSGTEYDLSASGSGGSTTFTGLTDTPSSYTGQAGKFLKVNTGATALEFTDSPGGGMTNPMTTVGDIIYASASGSPATPARLAGNGATGKMFLSQSGNGVTPSAPSWSTVTKSDVGLANVENTALSTWTGSSSVTTLGTITSGTWDGSTIAANRGGTGQTTYAIGDILYASSTTALSRLTASTSGYVLTTKGAGAAPAWEPLAGGGMVYPSTGVPYSTGSSWGTSYSISGTGTVLALTNSPTFTTPTISATASGTTAGRLGYSSGDLSFGTGLVQRVIVSTDATQTLTNKTISGLNNTLTVRLANDVTGTLPVGNGGTGITSYAVGDLLYASETGTLNKLSPGTAGYILETQGAGLAPRWIAPPTGGGLSAHALDYHSDVQYVMPIDVGQVLYHTGTEWTNDSPNNAGLVDKTTNQTISGTKIFSTNFIIPSTELSTPTKFTAITSTNAVGPISKSSALTMLGGLGGSTANFLRGDGTWAEVSGYLEIVVETETDFINAFSTATSQTKPVRIYINSNQLISGTPRPVTFTANRSFINDGTRQVEVIGVKSLYVVGSSGALAHFNTQANIVAFKNVIFRNMLFYSTGESYLWARGSGNLKFYECQFTNQPLSTETERNAVTFSDTDGDLTVPNGTGVSNNTCTIEFDGLTILNASSVNNNNIMTRLSPFIIRNKTADVGSDGNFYVTIKRMNPVQEKAKFAVAKLTSNVTANSGTTYKVAADDSWYYHSTQSAPGTGNIRGSSIFGYNYVHQVSGTSINKQFSAGEATVLTLSANTTLGINEVFDGAVGTILVEQNSVGNYNLGLTFFPQDVLSTPLTQVIIGSISDINKTANKHSLITFKRYGSKVTIVYGHQP